MTATTISAVEQRKLPGWPEALTGLAIYLVLIMLIGVAMLNMPDEQAALRGIFGMAANGVAGTLALLAAFSIRIRDLRAFGFRATEGRWLLIAVAMGLAAFILSILIEGIYFSFMPPETTQDDFMAAATSGPLALFIIVTTGALLTPFGEEVLFRGVIASALNKYGAWAGILGSATIFAAVHGPSVIFFNALLVGILTGFVFRKSGSLWPALLIHVVFNGLWLLTYSLG
ncbi:CPBP family intramembrane metalloprotease [Paracoccus caeni]|uniref:CPBP family intramembrane metalloprotease n=1 Tax=Paracoccus caeni TaxID=657651 RepID=A0A934SHC9_9RHOB|nr:type II CAAX endopeptidase family protein [Paracoccus caeni]MBK4217658.1 CPBP family intramembrane metalloprotease [Paracoccus caeni]